MRPTVVPWGCVTPTGSGREDKATSYLVVAIQMRMKGRLETPTVPSDPLRTPREGLNSD